jgi:hypothetical protein
VFSIKGRVNGAVLLWAFYYALSHTHLERASRIAIATPRHPPSLPAFGHMPKYERKFFETISKKNSSFSFAHTLFQFALKRGKGETTKMQKGNKSILIHFP